MENNFKIELKTEGDGTISNNITFKQAIGELIHQFNNKLWEDDDIYIVKYKDEIISELSYTDIQEML